MRLSTIIDESIISPTVPENNGTPKKLFLLVKTSKKFNFRNKSSRKIVLGNNEIKP